MFVPLEEDESRWFIRAVKEGVVRFQDCDPTCPRLRRRGVSGPDEFVMSPGEYRHLFSAPMTAGQRLNREYVPHIAAFAKVILEQGYRREWSAFSRYRSFQQDRTWKPKGAGYETDAEFYDADGRIYLHLEVKTKSADVEVIAAQLDRAGSLRELPPDTRKEIEYVLELAPRYFWLVGPGSVDPARHVFKVQTDGWTAQFERVSALPQSPALVTSITTPDSAGETTSTADRSRIADG